MNNNKKLNGFLTVQPKYAGFLKVINNTEESEKGMLLILHVSIANKREFLIMHDTNEIIRYQQILGLEKY